MPGAVIIYSRDGLAAHRPGVPPEDSMRDIANCMLQAGMQEEVDAFGNRSMTCFVARSFEYYLRATVLLASLPWVRHEPGIPDIGQLWLIDLDADRPHCMHNALVFNL